MWVILALASAACFGVVTVIDKRLLDYHLPGVSVLYLWIALVLSFYSGLVLLLTGLPLDAPWQASGMALGSGLAVGIGLALMFAGLKSDEATRAIAITQTNPIFVALLAVFFLEETLIPVQWAAIALVVLGTMLISLRNFPDCRFLLPTRGTPLLLGSALGLGVGFFAAKYALASLSIWSVFALQQLGVVLVFALFARPLVWRQMTLALRGRNTLLLMLLGEGVLPIIAIMLGLAASDLGPISLVAPVLGIRPLFVFIISTILSTARWGLMEESLTRQALGLKLTSIILIIGGMVALGSG